MRRILSLYTLLITVSVLCLYPALSFAGEPLSLQALLEEARSANPALKAFKEMVRGKAARAKAEGALDDPAFKIELMDLSRDNPSDITPGNAMLTRYTFSQMFPFPGKLSLKERIAFKDVGAAEAELTARELEVLAMVKEAYFDYAYFNEAIREVEGVKEVLSVMSRTAEARYATGHVSQQDIIKVNVEALMLTNELIGLKAEKDVAATRLKSLLNRPQDAPVEEGATLSKNRVELKTEDLIKTAERKNPEIKMVESEAEMNELRVDLANKNYYPDLMVGVAPVQRDGRFDSFDVMFQVNIPIWRDKYDNLGTEASANARAFRSRLISVKNTTGAEVKGAAIQVDAADRTRSLYETSLLPQAELSFESALKNYQTGKVDFIMLLDSERQLKRMRIDYLKSLLEYRKRIAALEKFVGEDLKTTVSKGEELLAATSEKH